ncbi:serine hydrolase FSH, partial [Macrophomina phaseolina]
VRILCLHGMGTNSKIFAAQTAFFRSMLPSSYEFVFLPGNLPCEAAEGITAFYPGPYRCWYDTPSTANIEKAQALVLNYVRKAGPFDGVMGFSQGAALAASIMLRHEAAGAASPFKFAVFMGSALPCSESTSRGIDLRIPFGCVAKTPTTTTQIPEHLLAGPTPDDSRASVTERFKLGRGESFYQMYHPSVDEVRIRSPTVHVIGAQDKWRLQSFDLIGLCAKENAFVLEHPLGHEMP